MKHYNLLGPFISCLAIDAGLLKKSSCLARALSVTKFIIINAKSDLISTLKYDQSHINYCYEFGNFITPKAAARHELLFNKLASE
jgi:hypothetical protein